MQFPEFHGEGPTPCSTAPNRDIFMPEKDDPDREAKIAEAKSDYCNSGTGCPYRMQCLAWALSHNERGVWGGTTDSDRRRIRRAHSKKLIPLSPVEIR